MVTDVSSTWAKGEGHERHIASQIFKYSVWPHRTLNSFTL
jgi:hypothetical protein